jgi:hypothetical protein
MSTKLHRFVLIVGIALSIVIPAAAAPSSGNEASGQAVPADTQGQRYLWALINAIDKAEAIVVTEHSYRTDAMDRLGPKKSVQRVYASRTLSQAQIAAFRADLAALDPTTQTWFSACMFEPHHTVTFFRAGKAHSALEICFECAQVEWPGMSDMPPESLNRGLYAFISRIGLQPKRDWRALALEHYR